MRLTRRGRIVRNVAYGILIAGIGAVVVFTPPGWWMR